ncbi:hypothetical protein GQ457_04G001410 [Hibiscus cannabinus]
MDLHFISCLALIVLLLTPKGVYGASFTFVNRCDYTVWPGILANAGSPGLDSTGFELPKDSSRSFQAPTGDCGSGQVECNGLGAAPPATLAEFTLGTGGQDFYDVSLVDGYNMPMIVEAVGVGSLRFNRMHDRLEPAMPVGTPCRRRRRLQERVWGVWKPRICCSGAYSTPPRASRRFILKCLKAACPRSYSYAYDDATSTFTCTGADYTVTFCPSSPSQKSTPVTRNPPMTYSGSDSSTEAGGSGSGEAMLTDGSWLAGFSNGRFSSLCCAICTHGHGIGKCCLSFGSMASILLVAFMEEWESGNFKSCQILCPLCITMLFPLEVNSGNN